MIVYWKEIGLLAMVVSAVYANSLTGSFHYDDFHSLVLNVHIRDWHRLADFFIDPSLFSVDPAKGMYRPLLLVSYAFNYALGEYEVLGYHLFNVLVHLACVVLVWHIAARHGPASGMCAGLIFAVHPITTEPVNYISSRSESFAVAFLLLGFANYLRRDRLACVIGPLAFILALLVKSIAIVLPGLLLLYDFFHDGRRFAIRRHLPYWAVTFCYLLIIFVNRFLGESLANAPRDLYSQLLTQCKAVVFYFKLLMMPVALNVEPQFVVAQQINGAVLCSAALITSLAYITFQTGQPRFYLGWFALALAPTFFIPLNVLVNEHRLYLPLAGLAIAAGLCWQHIGHKKLFLPGMICLLLWGGLSIQRNGDWRDELSLWSAAAEPDSQMPRVYVYLGNALREIGKLAEARTAYQKALSLDGANRSAGTNLANLYYEVALSDTSRRRAYLQQALQQYQHVLTIDPSYREALNNLGSTYMQLGDYQRANQIWRQVAERHANHAEAHFNLGLLQVRMGQPLSAVVHYRRALSLGEDPEVYRELGNALVGGGQLSAAADAYRSAIGLHSADVASRYNLAEVLLVMGEADLAKGRDAYAVSRWQQTREHLRTVLGQVAGHPKAQRRLRQLEERLP